MTLRRHQLSLCVAVLALAGTSCRYAIPIAYQVEPVPAVVGCADTTCAPEDQVSVTYLGVSGFVIRYRGNSLITAPFFTNPSLDSVTPSRYRFFKGRAPALRPDDSLIERLFPLEADNASMLLVGHGHYDHLLDVPYIAKHRARQSFIYGGPSVRHMLMGDSALRATPDRVIAIDGADVGDSVRVGRWFPSRDGAFRIMALRANHAPTVRLFRWGQMFAGGVVTEDQSHLPERAEDWKLGEPYAFIIDVLATGDTTPRFRIYFQDAPSDAPLGFPPASLGGRGFDLAILCVATARNVDPPSPDSLLRALRPRYVIASHWESFFRPQTQPLVLNPTSDVDAFFKSLAKGLSPRAAWSMPLPRTTILFAARR